MAEPGPPAAALSPRKKAAFTAVLLGLPIVVLGLVALAWYTTAAWSFRQAHAAEFSGTSFVAPDPAIGFGPRPDGEMHHLVPPVYDIYADDRGCRVDAPGQASPPAVDLLAIGCSFTFGFGVENDDTYVQRVAEELGTSVCNAAMPTYGTTASLLSVDGHADQRPKVIVYGFIGTHETRNLLPCATTDEPFCRGMAFVDLTGPTPVVRPPRAVPSEADGYLTDTLSGTAFGPRDVYWAVMRDVYRLTGRSAEAVNAPYEAQAADPAARARAVGYLVDRLAERATALDSRLVVAYIPIPGDVQPMPDGLQAALARHPEIDAVDLSHAFRAYEAEHGPQSLRLSEADAHPNAEGHRLVAEALSPVVARRLAEPPDAR